MSLRILADLREGISFAKLELPQSPNGKRRIPKVPLSENRFRPEVELQDSKSTKQEVE
jgi:hypothetical protein